MSDFQSLNDSSVNQMLVDNFVNIVSVNIAVPDGFGIDHQYRPEFTAIKAAGCVDPDACAELITELLDPVFGIRADTLGAVIIAASFAVLALIGAEKNVMIKVAHGDFWLVGAGIFAHS